MAHKIDINRSARLVSFITFISRLLGFTRDALIAGVLGAGFYADSFLVAFRIPNLLRRLFSDGSLSVAFVPILTDVLVKKGRTDALSLGRYLLTISFGILLIITLFCTIYTPSIIKLIVPGFFQFPEKFHLTVVLGRILFLYILLIGILAVLMSVLHTLNHFAIPAFAPVILNMTMIFALIICFLIVKNPVEQVIILAIAVICGGLCQILIQIPALKKQDFPFFQSIFYHHPEIKTIGQRFVPALVGSSVYQINIAVSTWFASFLPSGNISYLYYADRLTQFPLGLFALSISTVVLPQFSAQIAANKMKEAKKSFINAIQLVLLLCIPASVGLGILKEPIIKLLFQRGEFNILTTQLTADALLYYSIGLWAFAGVGILVAMFYALQDLMTPFWIGIIIIIINVCLSGLLVSPMQCGGLALSTSISAMIHFLLLAYHLKKKMGPLGYRQIMRTCLKSLFFAAVMGLGLIIISSYLLPIPDRGTFNLAVWLFFNIIIGMILYLGLFFIFGDNDQKNYFETFLLFKK